MEYYLIVLILILLPSAWFLQVPSKIKPTTKAPMKEIPPTNGTQIGNVTAVAPVPEKLAEVHIDQHKTIRISKGDLDDLLDVYMGKIAESAATIKDKENEINKLQTKDKRTMSC
ncbi:GD10151 [Drosophila simulans]|uniref:GD10151 n=1 Tax=Drosophila simulans TaxID=7240 RepID=B4QG57_DROSI|nr:GD10151 [Drosophila simulans]